MKSNEHVQYLRAAVKIPHVFLSRKSPMNTFTPKGCQDFPVARFNYTCDQFFSEVHCPRLLAYSAGKPMKRIAAILDKIIPKQKHPTLFQTTRMIQARGTKHQHQTCQAIVKSKQSSTLLINHWNKQERGTIHHDQDQRLAIVNNSTH